MTDGGGRGGVSMRGSEGGGKGRGCSSNGRGGSVKDGLGGSGLSRLTRRRGIRIVLRRCLRRSLSEHVGRSRSSSYSEMTWLVPIVDSEELPSSRTGHSSSIHRQLRLGAGSSVESLGVRRVETRRRRSGSRFEGRRRHGVGAWVEVMRCWAVKTGSMGGVGGGSEGHSC